MKPNLRATIETLLERGASQSEIQRRTGVDRKTIRRYAQAAKIPTPATGSDALAQSKSPPRPPGMSNTVASACEPHRAWIEAQLDLRRNAVSIHQDLVEQHGFSHGYNSVKRFVTKLRAREPERFDVLEFLPGEEAQVDWGEGAPTLHKPGRYKRPHLFVMTLKYSGKSFRKTVWKADQETWARLHEEAFHAFGGVPRYVVLDNLKAGVLRPDLYEPELNPLYAALLAHYGAVADPCRVGDPNRKGTVESAIQHTQGTALKGRRFETIEAQNEWLAHWEERWAAPRIHGRKKRQVLAMFQEEKPYLRPLPAEHFRYFKPGRRTVDDAGLVQVDGSYYAALPAAPHSEVMVRIFEREIEIFDLAGHCLRRHPKSLRKGSFTLERGDRLFNPSRETARLLLKAQRIGPLTAAFAYELFHRLGRPGQRALYGVVQLTRTYPRAAVEQLCGRLLESECFSYAALKRALERTRAQPDAAAEPALTQSGPDIRAVTEYQAFWNSHSVTSHSGADQCPCPSPSSNALCAACASLV